jgi:hypothetical protein
MVISSMMVGYQLLISRQRAVSAIWRLRSSSSIGTDWTRRQ